jgi:hypothetical protein
VIVASAADAVRSGNARASETARRILITHLSYHTDRDRGRGISSKA